MYNFWILTFQISCRNMQLTDTMRYIITWTIFNVHLSKESNCVHKYTSGPLQRYFCDTEYYSYHTNIERHHCTQSCITDPRCWVLSYNFMNQSCSFGAEPCAVVDLDPDSLLLIYRKRLKEQCVTWITPFNDPENTHFSKRLVETYPHHSHHYAVGRMIIGSDVHLGVVDKPSAAGFAYFVVGGAVTETMNYELLSVHPSCTLMWLPYQAGEKIPSGALKLGYYVASGKHSYSIRTFVYSDITYVYGVYVTDDSVGHYTYNGVKTKSTMDILTQPWRRKMQHSSKWWQKRC